MKERSAHWKRGQELAALHATFEDEAMIALLSCIPGAEVTLSDDGELVGWELFDCHDGDAEALEQLAEQRATERIKRLCSVSDWAAFRNAMTASKRIEGQRRANGRTLSPRQRQAEETHVLLDAIAKWRLNQWQRGQDLLWVHADFVDEAMIALLSCTPGAEVTLSDDGELVDWSCPDGDAAALETLAREQATERMKGHVSGSDWEAFRDAMAEDNRIARRWRDVVTELRAADEPLVLPALPPSPDATP